jgi:hypothetical protein
MSYQSQTHCQIKANSLFIFSSSSINRQWYFSFSNRLRAGCPLWRRHCLKATVTHETFLMAEELYHFRCRRIVFQCGRHSVLNFWASAGILVSTGTLFLSVWKCNLPTDLISMRGSVLNNIQNTHTAHTYTNTPQRSTCVP